MYPRSLNRMQGSRQSAEYVTRFLDAALSELQERHERGLIMLDLEPATISYIPGQRVHLYSSGIAHNHPALGATARREANHDYAPPEQLNGGHVTHQSDLYNLGVIAYELFTGELPPTAEQRRHGRTVRPLATFGNVPQRLNATITALLQLNPANRPASAAAALTLLREPAATGDGGVGGVLIALLVIGLIIGGISGAGNRTGAAAPPPLNPIPELQPVDPAAPALAIPVAPAAANGVPSGRVVFASNRAGSYDLFLADAGGGPPWNLTASPEHETAPALAAAGGYVAYVAQVDNDLAIGRLDLDTRQRRMLTAPAPGIVHSTPKPSPDGAWIAYSAGPTEAGDLYLMRADGSAQERIAGGPGHDHYPAWLPDGQRLVYVQQDAASAALILLNLDGSTPPQEIYRTSGRIQSPVVSPDGARIAFTQKQHDQWDLYVVPLSGGAAQQITATAGDEDAPAWSADGAQLLFAATADAADMTGVAQLYVSDADGANRERIVASEWDDRQPSWLP